MNAPLTSPALFERAWNGLPTGFDTPDADRLTVERTCGPGSAAYGELTTTGADRLLDWLRPTPDDVFVDLGSGRGRLVLRAALTTAVGRAAGVELSAHRHAVARAARLRLADHLPGPEAAALRARTGFLHGDLRRLLPAHATLVYAGATCFPEPLVAALTRALRERAPALRCLAIARRLHRTWAHGFETAGRMTLPMTWSDEVDVWLYRRVR